MDAMDQILEIDTANRVVVVQPGVLNATLSRAVLEHGLFYPPDPSSWEICSIGGNIATNAGGLCCVKYGVTTDFVLGLEVVLASGEVLRTGRRTVKGVAGYDLTKLIVGSEGTLAVVTEATLALRPASAAPWTAAAVFADMVGRRAGGSAGDRRRPRAEPAGVHGPDHDPRRQRLPRHGVPGGRRRDPRRADRWQRCRADDQCHRG